MRAGRWVSTARDSGDYTITGERLPAARIDPTFVRVYVRNCPPLYEFVFATPQVPDLRARVETVVALVRAQGFDALPRALEVLGAPAPEPAPRRVRRAGFDLALHVRGGA